MKDTAAELVISPLEVAIGPVFSTSQIEDSSIMMA